MIHKLKLMSEEVTILSSSSMFSSYNELSARKFSL